MRTRGDGGEEEEGVAEEDEDDDGAQSFAVYVLPENVKEQSRCIPKFVPRSIATALSIGYCGETRASVM